MSHELYTQIQQLIDINRHHNARALVEKGLAESPNDAELLYFSSLLHYIDDECEQGVNIAQAGLSVDPLHESLRHLLFRLFKQTDRLPEAELIIIKLIKENPRDAFYFGEYALLMLITFNLSKARALVSEALRISPDLQSAILVATLLDICSGKTAGSQEKLQKLVNDNPQSEQVLHILLVSLINRKKHRAALTLAQELLRQDPYDQAMIDVIIELRASTHWSAYPIWPLTRYGLLGVFGVWAIFILLIVINRYVQWTGFIYVVIGYLGLCLYSWVHGPILERILKRRGV